MRWRQLAVVAIFGAIAAIIGACGGDDEEAPSGGGDLPASAPHVAMIDNEFDPSTISAPAGQTVSIHLQNEGDNSHTFTSEALDVDVTVESGQSEIVDVDVPDGATEFVCRFHGSSGMTGTLTPE